MADSGDFIDPRSGKCSYAVIEAFELFKRLDSGRSYFFAQGMKNVSFNVISSREILDEIELQEPATEKDHLLAMIEVMDSVILAKKNKPS